MALEKKCKELLVRSLRPIPQELNEIDWKVTITNKKERLKKHLSSFSNLPGGGFLIFGVDDNGKIIGVEDGESRLIADTIANIARTALEPQINVHFITLNFDGRSLLGVYIEESFERPVHIKGKGMERAYIRAGGQSRLMSKDEIRRSIISSREVRFGEISAAFTQEVLSHWEDYFDFTEVVKRTRPSGFTDKDALNEHLYSLKLLSKVHDKFAPTNLAVLCCAKNFSQLHSYEKLAIRLIEYVGNDKLSAKRDITFNKGYSLSLDEIVSTISSWIPHSEKIKGASRIYQQTVPEIVIREIIVNAIIHRDFTMNNCSIFVEVYSNRMEVINPGGLLPELSIDRLIDHPSRTRNEVLADLMRKLNFAEERGSGIDKIVISMEREGPAPIQFYNGSDYFRACIFFNKSYSSMDRGEKIKAIFQHACLNSVIQKKTTNRSIRERFKLPARESAKVYKLIDEAINSAKIKLANPESPRKDHHYLPYWM